MYTLWGKVLMISYESESPPLGKNSTAFPTGRIPKVLRDPLADPAVVMKGGESIS